LAKKKVKSSRSESCLNGWSDYKVVLSDPTAFDLIYLPLYFHICHYFIRFSITDFSKTSAQAVATLASHSGKSNWREVESHCH